MSRRYIGTAILWRGEIAPVYVVWQANSGGSVSVLGGGTVTLRQLDGTSFVQGAASYVSGLASSVDLWYNLNTSTALGGSAMSAGEYELEFRWPGSVAGETSSRTMKRLVLLRIH